MEKNLVAFQFKSPLTLEHRKHILAHLDGRLPENWAALVLDNCEEQCAKFSTNLTEQERLVFDDLFLKQEHEGQDT